MNREVEMKLDLAEDDADELERVLSAAWPPDLLDLRSIYFDTPAGRLARAGLILRVRDAGGRMTQTVKRQPMSAAGMFDRPEWEVPVAAMRPVPDPRVTGVKLNPRLIAALAPIFTVRTHRCVWPNVFDTGIPVTLDRVTIEVPGRRHAFCELELEVGPDGRSAPYALVRRLDAVAPLRLGVFSKADRGRRLLRRWRGYEKAKRVVLDPAMPAIAAMGVLITACLRQYRMNEMILLERRVPEAVHQARVALRRLRSALAIFRPLIDGRARRFDRRLRDLAATLGRARDLDMLMATRPRNVPMAALTARREAAYAALDARLRDARTRALFVDLSEWLVSIEAGPAASNRSPPIARFASRALDRARRRLKRRARGFREQDEARRHRVRKAAKRLRYAHDFFAPIFGHDVDGDDIARFGKTLAAVQDHLGTLNDRAVARTILTRMGVVTNEPGGMRGQKRLIRRADQGLKEVMAARPYWARPRALLRDPV